MEREETFHSKHQDAKGLLIMGQVVSAIFLPRPVPERERRFDYFSELCIKGQSLSYSGVVSLSNV